ncbi:carbohydrate ABC transporter permease [Bacillaceae bacterium SIJ1]|uniref:carbohydrate ABC transporter permease n=1 Tax=Litoribacterium kuwaitense TaxID=1398745 RepID=UPI0013EDE674|nr:carbohydrate ABC transporter permease [Litoribacterium kuwaitense]NGP46207.1 carbohydrate ABC transporter permease [Litoribacterium kuwaitense]
MSVRKSYHLQVIGFLIICLHLLPIYITVVASFKDKTDLSSKWLLPDYFSVDHFTNAVDGGFFSALYNTIIITFFTVLLVVIVGAMTGYALARLKNVVTNIVLYATLGVMMVPEISLIVPLYKTMMNLHAINTFWGIILLGATYSLPLSIFIYTNFIKSIPKELDEAAEMDGCSPLQTFFRIILPQLGPVTASILILIGVKIFNQFLFPLYFLQAPEMRMITTYISTFFNENSNVNEASAAALLGTLPVILAYIFLQKYFVRGAMEGIGK